MGSPQRGRKNDVSHDSYARFAGSLGNYNPPQAYAWGYHLLPLRGWIFGYIGIQHYHGF